MTSPTSHQPPAVPRIHIHEPVYIERYDTGLSNLDALTPFSTLSKYAPNKGSFTTSSFWRESLTLLQKHMSFGRRKIRVDESVYLCGESFENLYLISSGLFKVVNLTNDGREQPVGVYFKGDWLGFDGIPTGQYGCSAIALDTGEVWTVRYESLLQSSAREPMLMRVVLAAMSAQLAHNRDSLLSMGTLPADARVCDFLLQWAHALAERGLRTDQFNVYLTRADIGHYLGLRLESVSRALSRLARCGIIQFNEKGRREISIPDLDALRDFIQKNSDTIPETPILQ